MNKISTLTYTVKHTPGGHIATCDKNKEISVFAKTEEKLDDGINAAAKLYAKFHPEDEHAKLLKTATLRLKRRD